ncbi:helix-turn-helix domain-containing protein [Nocardiopsis sp. HNM0947]|uniref:Helix-turn-helix domain-containing protein n=1 Tax=Nocardiopsis coralli TaxID=2772213 RepID=A0ABR9P9Z0_9ACTN|nr:AraC family transcriptional regulator [Nocardiopsis coralli]MBE3000661.1 helix-turn-helix domain-containing protein [Nocardiopsis coralli]
MPRTDNRRLPRYTAGEVDVPYAVSGHGEVLELDTVWAEHSHPTHELLWNERGVSSARVGARIWSVTPKLGLWIPAGVPHSGRAPAGTWHRAAQFRVGSAPGPAPEPVAVEMTPLLCLLLERLGTEHLAPEARERTELMVTDVLTPAAGEFFLTLPKAPLLAPIVAALREDPADGTTLRAWAGRLGVSTRTITRAFVGETGLTFSAWSALARVQHAMTLLARGERVDEVAEQVGYSSASAFGTAFRRATGMGPGQFRPR